MESNSGYPTKYKKNGTLVGETKALSTNLLYYNGYRLAAEMGRILIKSNERLRTQSSNGGLSHQLIQDLDEKAEALKATIRKRFWLEDKGYYAYMEDEHDQLVEQMEGLGESLVLLSDDFELSGHRRRSILDHTPVTENGIPCRWPQFDHGDVPLDDRHISERYHNGRIWPFVM